MLYAIQAASGISLEGQPYVGDSLKDVRAARAAGCRPVLVLTGNGTETARLNPPVEDIFDNLAAFVDQLLTEA